MKIDVLSDLHINTYFKDLDPDDKVIDKEKCDTNIHGHIHSICLDEKFCINASVEAIGFKPVCLSELLEKRG